ncbi:transcriptional regulator [Chromatiales bacterium (ex Bugula neritina AB1)]|nr:transcriptional regulator [Chromatiales bacterium (ex Bugula neritina AB1)]
MTTLATIENKLNEHLPGIHLDVQDESHMHNVPAGAESHFRVVIVSDTFNTMTLVARHRTVNKILKEELAGTVHALALHTFTPDEWHQRGKSATASPQCRGGSSA